MDRYVESSIDWEALRPECPECEQRLVLHNWDCRGIKPTLRCPNLRCLAHEVHYKLPTLRLDVAFEGEDF